MRYYMKRCCAGMLILLLLLFAAGCAEETETQKIQIGVSFDSYILERWVRDRDSFVSAISKARMADLDIQSANGEVEEQIRQIQTFIKNKVDVIMLIPVDCWAVSAVVNKALEAGIKVISYERLVADAPVDLYISFDNEEVGKLMAESLIENIRENGNIMMIGGPLHDHNTLLVEKGFIERIEQSGITIVEKSNVKDWMPEYGFEAMESIEAADISRIDGVMCGNDGLAGYAIRALAEQRLAGQIYVVGQDADLEACQRIVEGTQTMTVFKNFEEIAAQAAQYALVLGEGGELQGVEDVMENGECSVPFKAIKPIAVTADNMEDVITDTGFHIYDQVYLNVK